ncbi:hypothetical protein [Capnocytophaga sp. oral taxon 903]|uniref:hypothetical protein n=1 Tax=Capnocytophaga sp. oral taxon 903 TaxID=2748317 RepID=UPI001C55CA0C|nr:hypothetical protein [Capnocytophaga sp. oral taxon 903]
MNEQTTNKQRTNNEQTMNKRRCKSHGQVRERRRKPPPYTYPAFAGFLQRGN